MKLFILECTEDELRANRGLMDDIVDACKETINAFCGMTLCQAVQEDEPHESEE